MDKKTLILLILVLALAYFFRFWHLNSIPPGLYPDVALNAMQAISEPFKVFYPENFGREGLMISLTYLSFLIFGTSIWSLKFVAAFFGFLTVIGIYLLTKELFIQCEKKKAELIALFTTFFLSISFWHVNFSRIGFRVILLPFTMVFAFYFLFYGFRTKKPWSFILGGIFFGLGFYTYTSFRIAVLLLGLALLNWLLIYRVQKLNKQFFVYASLFLIVTFFVALPIGMYFLENPKEFISRAGPVSVFSTDSPVKEFEKSLILHLGMFNIYGDGNWRHNYSGSPLMYPWPVGIFFLMGIFYSMSQLFKARKSSMPFSKEIIASYGLLVLWWIIMLLPGILTYEGVPHALRTLGAAPPSYIFAGIGAAMFLAWLKNKYIGKNIKLFSYYLFISVLVIYCIFFAWYKYFIVWGQSPKVSDAFTQRFVDVGNGLNSYREEIKKYVIKSEGDLPVETTKFVQLSANRNEAIYINLNQIDDLNLAPGDMVFTMNKDFWPIEKIINKYPNGQLIEQERYWIYDTGYLY